VQHAALMGWNLSRLDQTWVCPDGDGAVGDAASGGNLTVVSAPSQAGDLAAGVNAIDASSSSGVPEVDLLIVRASTSGKKVVSPWAPRQGLDSGVVVGLLELGSIESASIPDGNKVVVSTGGELRSVWAPFKTANFAGVAFKVGDLVLGDADIVVEEPSVAGTSGKSVLVPACEISLMYMIWLEDLLIELTRDSCPNILRTLVWSSTSQIWISPVERPTLT
jgi:hypothetical protein